MKLDSINTLFLFLSLLSIMIASIVQIHLLQRIERNAPVMTFSIAEEPINMCVPGERL
jgi:hypothetical protein